MMVIADYERCEGHGLCTDQAPEIFELDNDDELIHHPFEGTDIPAGPLCDSNRSCQLRRSALRLPAFAEQFTCEPPAGRITIVSNEIHLSNERPNS